MNQKTKLKKTIFIAIMISMSIVLSIVESMISTTFFIIPGVKIGLANILTLVVLYIYGEKEALIVVVIRILLVAIISPVSTLLSFSLSISGGLFAIVTMIFVKKIKSLSIMSTSVMGSLMHMVGQILMAMFVLETPTLIYYLPYMMILSVPTGIFTGIIGKKLVYIFEHQLNGQKE
ncbi:MAG: Gx transporter family protein [Candidatus Izemoplasmatales bacterium]|nr:Gx transporter family protein [Candidatus Izemoplasmatales bacterium]